MRSREEYDSVLDLLASGVSAREASRATGVPLDTIRWWRRRPRIERPSNPCERCGHRQHDFAALPAPDYAYLLGAYLGDGHIATLPRGVHRLTIFCTLAYSSIAREVGSAVEAVIGRRAAMRPELRQNMLLVQSYSKAWPCLLPQHGPGLKHTRQIGLVEWQQRIVDAHPGPLARGLIHSDGSRHINRVRVRGRTYAYPRYEFTNRSDDIRRIFCQACDALGVEWRPMRADAISIARRASVAKLDSFIGPKC